MTGFNPADHPRGTAGRFTETRRPDPGQIDVDGDDLVAAARAAVAVHTAHMPPFTTMPAADQARVAVAVSEALAGTGRFGDNPPVLKVDERDGWALHIRDTRRNRTGSTLVALEFEDPADQPHDLTTDPLASGDDGVRALADKLSQQMRHTADLIGNLPRCPSCKEQATPASVGYWEDVWLRDGSRKLACPDCAPQFDGDDPDLYPHDEAGSLNPPWWEDR